MFERFKKQGGKTYKKIDSKTFKKALDKLKILKDFQNNPKSHFKIFKALDLDMKFDKIIKCKTSAIKELINLYSLQERYRNIKYKC